MQLKSKKMLGIEWLEMNTEDSCSNQEVVEPCKRR